MSETEPVQPTPTPAPTASPPPPSPVAPGANNRVLTTVALIALLCAVLLAGGWWFYRSVDGNLAPEQAANAFFKTNADDGPSAAYRSTTGTFQDGTPQTTWIATSQRLNLGSFYAAEWSSNQRMDDTASLRGRLLRLNAPSLPVSVDLRRIDGAWKVALVAIDESGAGTAAGLADNAVAGAGTGVTPNYAPSTGDAASQPSTLTPPAPIPSVPRFGDGDTQTAAAPMPALGRAGPPGTSLPSGTVAPTCMSVIWKAGYRSNKVQCPLYLPTTPGATQQCTAYGLDGSTAGVTVTFLDYDPITRRGSFDCRLNG